MRTWSKALVLAGLSLSGSAALAQDADEIVVEGERPVESEVIRQQVGQTYNGLELREPMQRYFDPICLQVHGLGEVANNQVAEMIRANVRAIGIPIAGEDCRTNALVIVVEDLAGLVNTLNKDNPRILPREIRFRLDHQIREGATDVAWHIEDHRGQYGDQLKFGNDIPGQTKGMSAQSKINGNTRPSLAKNTYSMAVMSGAVAYDIDQLVGMELERLADHATMRLLAPGFPEEWDASSGIASILAPFVAEQGSMRLTRFDKAYLTALYSLPANAPGQTLASAVARAYEEDGNGG